MWKALKNLFVNKTGNIIGIDIGTGSLKAVELEFSGEYPLVKSISITELPRGIIDNGYITNVEELTEKLRQLLSIMAITAKQAIVAVGGQVVFVREVVFPVMTAAELREAIKWDMDKYIPYKPDSYYFDFAVVGPGKNELEQRVLLVAAPHVCVNNIITAVRAVGLKPIAVDIEPLAIYRTLEDAENSLVIDIGDHVTQVTVFQQGALAVTRTIALGGQRFTQVIMTILELDYPEAERFKQRQKALLSHPGTAASASDLDRQLQMVVDDLAREVRRTVDYYQMQNRDMSIEKVFLTGGGAKLDNLAEQLSRRLGSDVIRHTPPSRLAVAGAIDKYYFNENFSQMAVAIGLALRGTDNDANQPTSTV